MTTPLPNIAALYQWIGRPYGTNRCWALTRDAYQEIAGIEVPENYYEAIRPNDLGNWFDTVHRVDRDAAGFRPLPWDIVSIRTHEFLILHCGIALNDREFIHAWGDAPIITEFDDPRWNRRIRGFLRLKQ